ncbi:hypothetical protein ACCT04_36160, partial [Rhizobium ruizarguesonis]
VDQRPVDLYPASASRKLALQVGDNSNAILFVIRCYLMNMEELATVPKWARRFPRVLKTLPPELIDYKGLTPVRLLFEADDLR